MTPDEPAVTTVTIKSLLYENAWRIIPTLYRELHIVKSYAARWQAGERWKPIVVQNGIITDGKHRAGAAVLLGLTEIETTAVQN